MTMADDGVPCAQQRSCVVKNAAGEWREEHFFTRTLVSSVVFPLELALSAGVSSPKHTSKFGVVKYTYFAPSTGRGL